MMDLKEMSHKRRLAISVAAAFVVLLSWTGIIDLLSREYVDASTLQAFAAYGTARVFNAAVSLASSVNISASLGIGFDVHPFKILEPISDLVEDYSSAMKVAISSLVIQKIIVEAVSTIFFKVILTVLGAVFVASIYFKDGAYSFFVFRLFAFFALIRFLLIMVIMMNGVVDQAFVDKAITPHMEEVKAASDELSEETASDNELSEDKRQGLIEMRDDLTEKRMQVKEDIVDNQQSLEASKEAIQPIRSRVDSMKDEMGTIQKLNVFSRKDEYNEAKENLDLAQAKIDGFKEKIGDLEERSQEIKNDIENTNDVLAGKNVDEGWITGMKNKISEFRDMAKWERVTSTLDDIIPSLLRLMAAFMFKTLIMPLVFLMLFLKGFKYIWGVDPRKWVKDEYASLRKIEE